MVEASESIGARNALTQFSGADRVAPHTGYYHCSAYIEEGALNEVCHRAGFHPMDDGHNVRLFTPYDEGVFTGAPKKIGKVQIAQPVQLFLIFIGYRHVGKKQRYS